MLHTQAASGNHLLPSRPTRRRSTPRLLALPVQLRSLIFDQVLQSFLPLLDDESLLDHLGLCLDGNGCPLPLSSSASLSRM